MKHRINSCGVALLAFLALPLSAKANMVWPSLYIAEQYYSWYIIAFGLAIELFAVKFFTKCGWWKSMVMDISMNAASAALGWILIPLSGIILEILFIPFNSPTFHWSHWILSYILAVFVNASVEGLALKLIFKLPMGKTYMWLLWVNSITIIICAFLPLLTR